MAGIILLLTILSTVPCEGYSTSSGESKWSDMEKECDPATPNVHVDSIYPPAVYNVDTINLDDEHNGDLWVGYYQVERPFRYIGCVQQRVLINNDTTFISIKGDPGHCFPGCGESTVIGVTKTRCYCLGDDYSLTNYTESGCKEMCAHPLVACGKDVLPNEYSYLSVYKIDPTVDVTSIHYTETPQLSEEKKCLLISTNIPKRFYWDGCLLEKGVMCSYDGRVEDIGCNNMSKYCSWINAANACFQSGGFPSLYSNIDGVTKSNFIPLWTGVFKTNVVYRYNAYIPVERRHDQKKYGYLTQGLKKLRFADVDSKKTVLCAGSGLSLVALFMITVGAVILISVSVVYTIAQSSESIERAENRQTIQVTCVTEFLDEPNPTNEETPVSNDTEGGASKVINPTNEETPVSNDTEGGASKTINPTNEETLVSNDAVGGASKAIQDQDTERNEEKHGYGASANEPLEEDRIDIYH